jgi:hypothetical protein
MNLQDKLTDVHLKVTAIETKLDIVLEQIVPQVRANTRFRYVCTGIWGFILAVGAAIGGYIGLVR